MDKIKVLIVMGGSAMGVGGIESMVINYYRRLNKDAFQIDFCFFGEGIGLYDDEIRSHGGRIFHLPIKGKHPLKSKRAMKRLLLREKYDVLHANLNAAGICSAVKIAKQCGVKVRISHAHSTGHGTQSRIRLMINEYGRKCIPAYATDFFACSDLAGKWYYGERPFTIVPNAVDTQRFVFDAQVRCEVREMLGVQDQLVLGHVGNLGYPKNQSYSLDVLASLKRKRANAQLWLIGEGEDLSLLQQKAEALGIADSVRFFGKRDDVPRLLQAMDVFLLPSFFEGFPVVIAEAVACDLPCIVSDTVTSMICISDKVEQLSITADPTLWSDAVLKYCDLPRKDHRDLMIRSGFDIDTEAKKLENFYRNGRFE